MSKYHLFLFKSLLIPWFLLAILVLYIRKIKIYEFCLFIFHIYFKEEFFIRSSEIYCFYYSTFSFDCIAVFNICDSDLWFFSDRWHRFILNLKVFFSSENIKKELRVKLKKVQIMIYTGIQNIVTGKLHPFLLYSIIRMYHILFRRFNFHNPRVYWFD